MENHSRSPLYDRMYDRSVPREQELLAAKLVDEISHLERWLDTQSRVETSRVTNIHISVVPTIRALLETRRKLLRSIETCL